MAQCMYCRDTLFLAEPAKAVRVISCIDGEDEPRFVALCEDHYQGWEGEIAFSDVFYFDNEVEQGFLPGERRTYVFTDFEVRRDPTSGPGWFVFGRNAEKYGRNSDGKGSYIRLVGWRSWRSRPTGKLRGNMAGFRTRREATQALEACTAVAGGWSVSDAERTYTDDESNRRYALVRRFADKASAEAFVTRQDRGKLARGTFEVCGPSA